MYASRSELAAFDLLSNAAKCRAILTLVRAFVEIDREIIAERQVPNLYESGVRYEFQKAVDDWKDLVQCLRTGRGSCNSLTAWRCAELQMDGELDAVPYVQSQTIAKPNGEVVDLFHILCERQSFPEGHPHRFECPSRTLGMPASDPSMAGARVIASAGGAVVGDAGVVFTGGLDQVGSVCWGD